MNRQFAAALLAVPFGLFHFINIASAADLVLKVVSCSAEQDAKGDWRLSIEVRNTTSAPLKTLASSLPWGVRANSELVATPLINEGASLQQAFFIDDPRVDPIVIAAGASIRGSINLSQRFPGLSERTKEGEQILVGWKVARGRELFGDAAPTGAVLLKDVGGVCREF